MKNIFKLSLYPVNIFIYKGLNDKQFYKEMKKDSKGRASDDFIKEMSTRDFEACVHSFKGNIVMRFMDKKPRHEVIAHECLHATGRIMKHVGIDMADESEEAWSYMIGFLFKEVIGKKKCKKILKKKKK
jgi:hypothetical protein